MPEAGSWATQAFFVADLSGINQIPPVDTLGTGRAEYRLVNSRRLAYSLSVRDTPEVTDAHIHAGTRTENGPVVARLFGPSRGTTVNGLLARGVITQSDLMGPLAGRRITDLVRLMRTGRAYTNVHTVRFPEGEIRGQIREVGRVALRAGEGSWQEGSWTLE